MPLASARKALGFVASNPLFLLHSARNAARGAITLPIALLSELIARRPPGKGPERIELFAADPALGLALTVDVYGNKIDVSSEITLQAIEPSADSLRLDLRVKNLRVEAPPGSPAAMMIQAINFSRPAALLQLMPKKHAVLVEADEDRFVLDLLRIPALARNPGLRRILTALSFIRVSGVRVEGELLALDLEINPLAAPSALRAALQRSA